MTVQNSSFLEDLNQILEKHLTIFQDVKDLIAKADDNLLPEIQTLVDKEQNILFDLEEIRSHIPPGIDANFEG